MGHFMGNDDQTMGLGVAYSWTKLDAKNASMLFGNLIWQMFFPLKPSLSSGISQLATID
jgi:hypothetical protein